MKCSAATLVAAMAKPAGNRDRAGKAAIQAHRRVRAARRRQFRSLAGRAAAGVELEHRRRHRGTADFEGLSAAARRREPGTRDRPLSDGGRAFPQLRTVGRQRWSIRERRARPRCSRCSRPMSRIRATAGRTRWSTCGATSRSIAPRPPADAPPANAHDAYLGLIRVLATRTAELHLALATPTGDAGFAPQPLTRADLDGYRQRATEEMRDALGMLQVHDSTSSRGPNATRPVRCLRSRTDAGAHRALRVAGAAWPEDPHPRRLSTSGKCC